MTSTTPLVADSPFFDPAPRRRATLIGFTAVLMLALLALLTALSGSVPPFQLLAMTLGIATAVGIAASLARGAVLPGPRADVSR